MNTKTINDLRKEFHEWCGLLSIDEIGTNPDLMRIIERLERMLIAAGA